MTCPPCWRASVCKQPFSQFIILPTVSHLGAYGVGHFRKLSNVFYRFTWKKKGEGGCLMSMYANNFENVKKTMKDQENYFRLTLCFNQKWIFTITIGRLIKASFWHWRVIKQTWTLHTTKRDEKKKHYSNMHHVSCSNSVRYIYTLEQRRRKLYLFIYPYIKCSLVSYVLTITESRSEQTSS